MIGLLGALALLAALLLVPASASANEPQQTANALLEEVNQAAAEADVDPSAILESEIEITVDDSEDPIRVTVEEALLRIAGRSVIDTENNNGIFGLPQTSVGGIFHLYTDIEVELFPLTHESQLPPAPTVTHYDVAESDYSPDTPLVPVLNPLFLGAALAGVELPGEVTDLAPGLSDPILLIHGGGKLKSVQGSGWDLGFHGAGSYLLASNADTGERETTDDDPWPMWLPFFTGTLTEPDDQIDFLGFAQVIEGSECVLIRASDNPSSPLYPRIVSRICIGLGTIIGDGVAQHDEGPLNFRTDLAPLWEEAPQEVKDLMAVVDEAIGQVPVGDVLDLIGELTGELPETPEVPTTQSSGAGSGSVVDGVSRTTSSLLKGLGR